MALSTRKGRTMAIMKSEQIMSESTKSFEDAIQTAVTRVDATVKGLASAYVNEMYTTIKNGKIEKYRVNLQMTFEVMPPKADDKAKRAKKK